jgi:UDP-glucose 4-epimerase
MAQEGKLRYLVTGSAGFVGSGLTQRLLAAGHSVVGYDNFSTGQDEFIEAAQRHPNFRLVRADVLDLKTLTDSMAGIDLVFHLAANADVRHGTQHPRKDLEQNTLATHNVLEAMRSQRVGRIAFASSGAVYGDASVIPTPEDAPFPVQTSLYGASKAAAEGLITAYCGGFGFQAYIFRFVSILGERYSHGHVFDFYKQLADNPHRLRVLGNGRQRKSYLYVGDCIDAMQLAIERARERINVFNLGQDTYCELNESIGWICAALGVCPQIEYSGGDRGWVGDSPFIYLDTQRIRSLGWEPKLSIEQGVNATVEYLRSHPSLLVARQ